MGRSRDKGRGKVKRMEGCDREGEETGVKRGQSGGG